MTAVALSWSDSPKLPRMAAWLMVLLVHGLMAVWLLGSGRMTLPSDEAARISLRWLPPEQPAAVQPHPALPSASAARPAASTASRPAPAAPADAIAPASEEPPATASLLLGLPAGSIDGGDGISAAGVAPRLIGRREVHPAFGPRRNYFRIRRQMSPEQIVHGVAQLLGLWPPGYTVDPCELGKQDMDYFQNAVEEADRDVLRAAVLQVSARCR
ncbi:hypothetical protein O0J72_02430 [Stenotrophomonas sp. Sm3212]|uniref:Transmembrane protein n=1 Tax=Stenotrophomonas pavanii TaxID=487698 RepID=A0A246L3V5_9GAMM|nr:MULTISPECIES: hypothetical protein [Stenotrophomonas]MBC9079144.1 hypothetical protein [Stenotrophomonas maltophilia]MBC9091439.1 hypothetical protein [Stenotrophomonas maltophilia]MBH1387736.1 hypothetical protein [Stenotrophomonas maltophilia]MBH1521491.1 hypothetical protein [Stenotrophomonas maltophilia]MBN4941110.1 hypothetical protein [Stenotrophomonas maltophilia]